MPDALGDGGGDTEVGATPVDPVDRVDPVTVTIARRVSEDRAADFEQFSRDALSAASTWPGFLGGGLLRPPAGEHEFHIVYRFADEDTLRAWEESTERAELLARAEPFVRSVAVWRVRGLHDWFDLPGRAGPSAPKWKLAVVACACVVPMSLAMSLWIVPALDVVPLFPRTVITSIIFAVYMTWFAVPWLSGLVRGWLYPDG